MKKFTALFLSFFFISSLGFASGEPMLYKPEFKCPETHPLIKDLLGEIQGFQKRLKKDLQCKEVAVEFDKITKLLEGRKDFLSLILSNEGTVLSADNAKSIQDYSKSVTEEVGVLINLISGVGDDGILGTGLKLFGGDNACQLETEDEFEGIERLTSAAYEATSLLSKVAGPYGVPLQIGAEVVSGVVKGLKAYSERVKNVDFSKGEDGGLATRQFYENAVCMMVKIDADLGRLVNPKRHLQKLNYVRAQAQETQQKITEICEDCRIIIEADDVTEAKEELERIIERSREDKPVVYKISRVAFQGRLDLDWLEREVDKFESLVHFGSSGIGKSEADDTRLVVRNFLYTTATKDFLRHYLDEAVFYNKGFVEHTKEVVEVFEEDLKEIGERIEYVPLPEELIQAVDYEIEEAWQGLPRSKQDRAFAVKSLAFRYATFYPELFKLYTVITKAPLLDVFEAEVGTQIANSVDLWRRTTTSFEVVSEYCDFFRNVLHYSKVIKQVCESEDFEEVELRTSYQAFYLAGIIGEKRNFVERRRGPIDFDLENRFESIARLRKSRGNYVALAEYGLDYAYILQLEKTSRENDFGFINNLKGGGSKSKEMPFEDWWKTVDKQNEMLFESLNVN